MVGILLQDNVHDKVLSPSSLSIFLNANVTMQNNIEGDEIEGGGRGRGPVAVQEGGSLIF